MTKLKLAVFVPSKAATFVVAEYEGETVVGTLSGEASPLFDPELSRNDNRYLKSLINTKCEDDDVLGKQINSVLRQFRKGTYLKPRKNNLAKAFSRRRG